MLSAFSFIALGASFLWAGASVLLESQSASVTAMTLTQELAYAILAQFASAAYCAPDGIATWSCRCKTNFGYNQNCHLIYSQANCDALPDIKVYATGGDGAETQYCQFNYLVAQSKAHRF